MDKNNLLSDAEKAVLPKDDPSIEVQLGGLPVENWMTTTFNKCIEERVRAHGWSRIQGSSPQGKRGYCRTSIGNKTVYAHKFVYYLFHPKAPKILRLDHLDGDRSNNRIENLRQATSGENACNRVKQKNNTSGYKGVGKSWKMWRTMIWYKFHENHKSDYYHMGTYQRAEDAAYAYDVAAQCLHGRFASLNHITLNDKEKEKSIEEKVHKILLSRGWKFN